MTQSAGWREHQKPDWRVFERIAPQVPAAQPHLQVEDALIWINREGSNRPARRKSPEIRRPGMSGFGTPTAALPEGLPMTTRKRGWF
jgi:hypothetical protein